ncbi:MAG: hypothetical protein ACE5L7_09770 [Candidatus Aminicenantales bacterium]
MEEVRLRFLTGIFFVSTATLCLEISLTRYFSISQQYHFAFWVVSIAFLGYGASGSFLTLFRNLRLTNPHWFLSLASLLFSLSILLSFFLCNRLPFDFMKLSWDKGQISYIFLYYLFLCLPFFFAGLTISFAISTRAESVHKIYFSDLFGAGAGTLLAVFVFLYRGEKCVMLYISFLALMASYFFSPKRPVAFKPLLLFLLALEAVLLFHPPSWLAFRISPFKALPLALKYPHAQHLFTKWNAISRIDVIDSPAVRYAPGLSLLFDKKIPSQLGLSIDGGELTAVNRFSHSRTDDLEFLSYLPSSVVYSFVQNPRALIIDPKGGLDVLAAKFFRASSIKVIENNPLIIKILNTELASFSGKIYQKGDVKPVSAFPRSALQKENEVYDLIVLSLTDVFGASSSGLYGFGENYLYTLDSFVQMLSRLSPQGIVSMSLYMIPPPRQEIRVLATWIEALEKSGRTPSDHLMALRSWGTISYFIKKSPFQNREIQILKGFAEKGLFDLVYYPGIRREETNLHNRFETPLYYELTHKLLDPKSREELYKDYLFSISPVTDDRPFFYNFFKLEKIRLTYRALGNRWLPFLQGEFLVLLLFFQSLAIAFVLILLPLIASRKAKVNLGKGHIKVFFYFGLIGMAFMFVEITLIQKFILFLGHPLYSVSITIFSLLFSAGIGSYSSKKILGAPLRRNLRVGLLGCAGIIFVFLLLFPIFYRNLIGLGLGLRIILSFFVIFPLGFFMGFPFPNGIRLLERRAKGVIPWAWATNAFSSVINSILALMLAFWMGYSSVLVLAAAGYLLAIPFLGFSNHRYKPHS